MLLSACQAVEDATEDAPDTDTDIISELSAVLIEYWEGDC